MIILPAKTAVLIDGANLYASAKLAGFEIDYKKILTHFSPCHTAQFYTAIEEDEDLVPLRPMVDWVAYNGYIVTTKALKKFVNKGVEKIKGNMAVDITVDAIDIAPHVERIVLFSGDSDLTRMVKAVQQRGVHVVVVSEVSITSDELRRQANTFINLIDLKNDISKPSKVNVSRPAPTLGTLAEAIEVNGNK